MGRKGEEMDALGEETISTQYLGFCLAGEECGIGILRVLEIVEYPVVTRVPTTPPWVRGVINLRGGVVPVIDLAVKFGLPDSPVTKQTCIIIVEASLEGERTVMGMVVDSVSQVIELGPSDIVASPAFGTAVKVDYLLGLGKQGDRFVLLLDTDKVLSASELMKVTSLEELVSGGAEPATGEASAASDQAAKPDPTHDGTGSEVAAR
jgi:purine-binding chemotaxis protein CheW